MVELTDKQRKIMVFIQKSSGVSGFPPTLREIGAHFDIAPSSVLDHLRALERKGFIRRLPLKPRCLEVLRSVAAQ